MYSLTVSNKQPNVNEPVVLTLTDKSSNNEYSFYCIDSNNNKEIIGYYSENNFVSWIPDKDGVYTVYGIVKNMKNGDEVLSQPVVITSKFKDNIK